MIEYPLFQIKDQVIKAPFEHIFQEAIGNAITLSAIPTSTAPLLKDNEWGVYGGKIYFRIRNTIYEITPSATITIS